MAVLPLRAGRRVSAANRSPTLLSLAPPLMATPKKPQPFDRPSLAPPFLYQMVEEWYSHNVLGVPAGFTLTQWQDLECQALIYKHLVSGIRVPPPLLVCLFRGADLLNQNTKDETSSWLNTVVSRLENQIDNFGAELESSRLLPLKKGMQRLPRLVHLEKSIERHKAHITVLGLIFRRLHDDEFSPQQVNTVKGFIEDYVERNQEDFIEDLYCTLCTEKVKPLEDIVSLAPSGLIKGVAALSVTEVLTTTSQTTTSPTQMGSTPYHMSLQQMKDITNNFSNEIGRGGFGVVYKGVLENGKMVAVKKLLHSMPSSQEKFENEVNLLMNLKHGNIVRLLGYCYETQHLRTPHEGKFVFAWNTDCLLCLERLPNGSLDKYISDPSIGLDWPARFKIIEGISYGIKYLHEQTSGPIIHLDLKPANILLDENMRPKITDFGLSRLLGQKQTICTAVTSGTLGYISPEYLRGIITPMSDIFSLGVIIMEVITGHREYPYDIRTSSEDFIELELRKWSVVLQKEPGYISLEDDCQQIKRCIQIGLICVNPMRTKRPPINKIIDMLQGLESINWYIKNEVTTTATINTRVLHLFFSNHRGEYETLHLYILQQSE